MYFNRSYLDQQMIYALFNGPLETTYYTASCHCPCLVQTLGLPEFCGCHNDADVNSSLPEYYAI